MKTCLKILNLLLLGISALAAVLCFVFAGPITESSNLIIYIGASFAIIMVIVILRVTCPFTRTKRALRTAKAAPPRI